MGGLVELIESGSVVFDELPVLLAEHERHAALSAAAIGRFDATREFAVDGSLTMSAWLRHHCRMSSRDARGWTQRGRFLHAHPVIAEAAAGSVLSAGQVTALQVNTNPVTEPFLDDAAEMLVTAAAPLSVAETEMLARHWRLRVEAIADTREPKIPERQLVTARDAQGSLVGRFVLDAAGTAQFEHAIATATTWDGAGDGRSLIRRQADALVEIMAFFNANHTAAGTPRHRSHVELAIAAESLNDMWCCATTTDGIVLDPAATVTLLCDSVVQRFVMQADVPLSIGRADRTVPLDVSRAVAKRDQGCRFPGCDRPVRWSEAHHIVFWRHGGDTALHNLALLCSRHHHLVHTDGWHAKLLPDATLQVSTPTGEILTSHPPGITRLQM